MIELVGIVVIFLACYGIYSYVTRPRKMWAVGLIYIFVSIGTFSASFSAILSDPTVAIAQFFVAAIFGFSGVKMAFHKDQNLG